MTIAGGGKIAIAAAANATVNIDTDNANNAVLTANASFINWGTSAIYATNTGVTVNFSTSDATTADANKGLTTVGAFGNNAGANQFLRSVTFAAAHPSGATATGIILNGNVFVDGGNIEFNSATPTPQQNTTFDTAQGATAVAGAFSATNSFGTTGAAKDIASGIGDVTAASAAGSFSEPTKFSKGFLALLPQAPTPITRRQENRLRQPRLRII